MSENMAKNPSKSLRELREETARRVLGMADDEPNAATGHITRAAYLALVGNVGFNIDEEKVWVPQLSEGRYFDGTYEWDYDPTDDRWDPIRAPEGMPSRPKLENLSRVVTKYEPLKFEPEQPVILDFGPESDSHDHKPVQHRDGKEPWCRVCTLTADFREPVSKITAKASLTGEAYPALLRVTVEKSEVGLTVWDDGGRYIVVDPVAVFTIDEGLANLDEGLSGLADRYPEVSTFVASMYRELEANAGKGDQAAWRQMGIREAWQEISWHLGKLTVAIKSEDEKLMRELLADVANGAMMFADILDQRKLS